jgi:hypothetical protein
MRDLRLSNIVNVIYQIVNTVYELAQCPG